MRWLLPWLLAVGVAHAGAQESFEAGVQASRAGDQSIAVAQFLAALDEGGRDPAVYHGLGNALYRQGKPGPAIAAWRRGQLLAPRDGDIAANLDRARRESKDRIEEPTGVHGPFFWQGWLSLRDSALGAGLSFTAALGALLVRRLLAWRAPGHTRWGWESIVCALLGLLLLGSTGSAARQPDSAVVVSPEVVARSTLDPTGIDLFALHEGAEVRVVDSSGAHVLIALPDERKGWLPASALLSADPAAPFDLPQ